MMEQIKVTLTRSLIGYPQDQRATVKALGLGKIGTSVVKNDTSTIRGMIRKVEHLVKVEKVEA
jgi:large subunit ribosomal protein L30